MEEEGGTRKEVRWGNNDSIRECLRFKKFIRNHTKIGKFVPNKKNSRRPENTVKSVVLAPYRIPKDSAETDP